MPAKESAEWEAKSSTDTTAVISSGGMMMLQVPNTANPTDPRDAGRRGQCNIDTTCSKLGILYTLPQSPVRGYASGLWQLGDASHM